MTKGAYTVVHLSDVTEYLESVDVDASATLVADMTTMGLGHFGEVDTKQLKGSIRELRSGPHRISYFIYEQTLYFIQAWRKKDQKTKRKYIEYADRIYNYIVYEEHKKTNKKNTKRTC